MSNELTAVGVENVGVGPDTPEIRDNIFQWARDDLTLDSEIKAVVVGFDPYLNIVKLSKVRTSHGRVYRIHRQ